MHYFIDNKDDFFKHLPTLQSYVKEIETPILGVDVETYSLTNKLEVPKPIDYYGEDREQLEREAFERTGMNLHADLEGCTATLQLGLDPINVSDTQYVLDVRRLGREVIKTHIKPIIENSLVIYHNGTYEEMFFIKEFDIWTKRSRDTRILGQIIHAGDSYQHTLDGEYQKFFDYGWWLADTRVEFGEAMSFADFRKYKKQNQKSDWTDPNLTPMQIKYGAGDVRWLLYLYDVQKKALAALIKRTKQKGLNDTVRLNCQLVQQFALMQLRGVPLDAQYHASVTQWLDNKYAQAVEGLGAYFSTEVERRLPYEHKTKAGKIVTRYHKWTELVPLNVKSPQQIKRALEDQGIKLPKKESTGEAALKKVRHKHPAIEHILRAKKAGHLSDNYGQCMIDMIKSDGRIHFSVHVIGTKTGRSSSSEPNVQKIPNHENLFGERKAGPLFRTAFTIPIGSYIDPVTMEKEEWIWISGDLSQIEPRAIAQLTNDETLVTELNDPDGDLHGVSGQAFTGRDTKPKKGEYDRDTIGKTGGLQVLYRAGAKSFAEYMFDKTVDEENPVVWTKAEAQEKIDTYFSWFPQIKEAMEDIDEQVKNRIGTDSLKHFINRRPIFEIFTDGTCKNPEGVSPGSYVSYEKWCLSEIQEKLAKRVLEREQELGRALTPEEDPLHKWHKVIREEPILDEEGNETGEFTYKESYWNEYAKTVSAVCREAWNFKFQGNCGVLFKLGLLRSAKEMEKLPGFDAVREGIIFPVHDEINVIVRKKYEKQVMEIMERNMIGAGKLFINRVPIKVDIKSGMNWASTH